MISLDEELNGELKVVQPKEKSDLEARVETLKKKFNKYLKSENKYLKESGPAEIRTQNHIV